MAQQRTNRLRANELGNKVMEYTPTINKTMWDAREQKITEIFIPLNTTPQTMTNILGQKKEIEVIRGTQHPKAYIDFEDALREQEYQFFLVVNHKKRRVTDYVDRNCQSVLGNENL